MSDPNVLFDKDEQVGLVTLNRPERLNALSAGLRADLEAALRQADEDSGISVIVLRGAGRAFCAGFDMSREGRPDAAPRDALEYHARLTNSLRTLMAPWFAKKPVIASVHGYALGGGCELALFCDLTIAAEDAQFGEPEILFSQAGPGLAMPFLIGHKKARELLYFGDRISARTALDLNLINRIVPPQDLPAATLKYAKRLSLIAPEALKATKLAISRGADALGFQNAIAAGLDVLAPLYAATTEVGAQFDEIRKRDGLKAALKWRHDQFKAFD